MATISDTARWQRRSAGLMALANLLVAVCIGVASRRLAKVERVPPVSSEMPVEYRREVRYRTLLLRYGSERVSRETFLRYGAADEFARADANGDGVLDTGE